MKTIMVSASRAAADLDSLFTGRGTTALLPAVRTMARFLLSPGTHRGITEPPG